MSTVRFKTLLTSLLGIMLVLALILTISTTFQTSEQQFASADAVFLSEFEVSDGYLYNDQNKIVGQSDMTALSPYTWGPDGKAHMRDSFSGYGAVYPEPSYTVTRITSGEGLRNFINSAPEVTTPRKVGVLMNDITLDLSPSTINSSTAVFGGILDGNAYKITIISPEGGTNLAYNNENKGVVGDYTAKYGSGYQYTGMICAINIGEIKNCNFVWQSDLSAESNKFNLSVLGAISSTNSDAWQPVSGIVCGLNYNGGRLYNNTLDVQGAFSIVKRSNHKSDASDLVYNVCITGGYVGYLGANGTIERCTLNNDGGILAGCEGSIAGWTYNTDNQRTLMVAGGLVASLASDATAKIIKCSLSGIGNVNATCSISPWRNSKDGSYGFAGGAVGASVRVEDVSNYRAYDLQDGQIDGILSSWIGKRTNVWWSNKDASISQREVKTISGCLFDYIGEDITRDRAKNVVLLFNYLDQVKNTTPLGQTPYTTLDSGRAMTYGMWAEVFATNTDGKVRVSYDYSRTTDPVKVEAVSDGFSDVYEDPNSSEGLATLMDNATKSTTYSLDNTATKLGKYIFDCSLLGLDGSGNLVRAEYRILPNQYLGAQLLFMSPNIEGSIAYTFGEVVKPTFIDNNTASNTEYYITNNSRYYNGMPVISPSLLLQRSNGEYTATIEGCYNLEEKYTLLDGYALTNYKYVRNESNMQLYDENKHLPGAYEFHPKITVSLGQGSADFAYYNGNTKVVARYDKDFVYNYDIYAGTENHFVADCKSSSSNWLKEDSVNIGYYSQGKYAAGLIDYYTYKIGNSLESDLQPFGVAAYNAFPVSESGKYLYSFKAYLENPYEAAKENPDPNALYIRIGESQKQAFVDKEAPIIKNIRYFEYNPLAVDNKGDEISANQLNEWLTHDLLITYLVTDNNLSGINSGSGQTTVNRVTDSRWECQLHLNGTTNSQTVIYADQAGNIVTKTFSAMIDTTPTELANVITLNYAEYLGYYGQLGYCPKEVQISFTPKFGNSGAHLEYSYQVDDSGNDIWLTYDKVLKRNVPNDFVINFDIIKSNLKMRLVNDSALYQTSYVNDLDDDPNNDGYVQNGAEAFEEAIEWTVQITIAYIGISLDNLYHGNNVLTSLVLRDLFNKSYDATDEAALEIPLSVKVYADGNNSTLRTATTSVIYSELYAYQQPEILQDEVLVKAKYSSKDAGAGRTVTITLQRADATNGKYLFYFTNKKYTDADLMHKENNQFYTVDGVTINKAILDVKLGEMPDQLKPSYVYGELLPEEVTVNGAGEEVVTLRLNTLARPTITDGQITAYPNVGPYEVNAEMKGENNNYNLRVTKTNVEITKKSVVVTTSIDDNKGYTSVITYNGIAHTVKGTYVDVFGVTKDAKINIFENASLSGTPVDGTQGVINVATYYAELTIADQNYQVSNTGKVVEFNIVKAYLNLNLAEQTYEFKNAKIDYEIVTQGNYAADTYNREQFSIVYYSVNDSGVADYAHPLNEIKNVGKYLVDIALLNNPNYENKEYGDTYISITKASTIMTAQDIKVAYTGAEFAFNIVDTLVSVKAANSETKIIGEETNADGIKAIYYYNNVDNTKTEALSSSAFNLYRYPVDSVVPELVTDVNILKFTAVGDYRFKLEFKGDQNYLKNDVNIRFTITKASFEGLEFNDKTVNYNSDPAFEGYTLELEKNTALTQYASMEGFSLVYNNGDEDKDALAADYTPFKFKEINEYVITATISLPNYETMFIAAKLTIDKTALPDNIRQVVSQVNETIYYDGKIHPAVFEGFDIDETTGKLKCEYKKGYENVKVIETVYYNTDPITVTYNSNAVPVDVGEYSGQITFTSEKYADKTISTAMRITPQPIGPSNINWSTLQKYATQITSNTDIKNLMTTTFKDENGNDIRCRLVFYNKATNERVELSEDNKLPAGEYIVRAETDNKNYNISFEGSSDTILTIAAAGSSPKPSTPSDNTTPDDEETSNGFMDIIKENIMYIAIGAGALVVIVVILIIVSASKKKGGKKGKGKKKPAGKKPAKNAASKDKATF